VLSSCLVGVTKVVAHDLIMCPRRLVKNVALFVLPLSCQQLLLGRRRLILPKQLCPGTRAAAASISRLTSSSGWPKDNTTGFTTGAKTQIIGTPLTRLGCGCFGSAYWPAADRAVAANPHQFGRPDHDPRRRACSGFRLLVVVFCGAGIWVLLFPFEIHSPFRNSKRPRPWGNRGS